MIVLRTRGMRVGRFSYPPRLAVIFASVKIRNQENHVFLIRVSPIQGAEHELKRIRMRTATRIVFFVGEFGGMLDVP